jgi:hypothetical protein
LAKGLRKIRLSIASKGKGKSGGARVISYFITSDGEIWLLAIYDKAEVDTLTPAELRALADAADRIRKG